MKKDFSKVVQEKLDIEGKTHRLEEKLADVQVLTHRFLFYYGLYSCLIDVK